MTQQQPQCPACERAQQEPRTALFQPNCRSCEQRAAASMPSVAEAVKAQAMTPAYREMLDRMWPQGWGPGDHQEVKEWFRRMKGQR